MSKRSRGQVGLARPDNNKNVLQSVQNGNKGFSLLSFFTLYTMCSLATAAAAEEEHIVAHTEIK